MRIKRFTRDEQAHDFGRALEGVVHAAIPKKSLPSDRRVASSSKRMRSFVAATTAHLHRIIGDSPGRFSRPHFAHGCFDAQIARFTIEQRRGVKRHRFHREHISGHFRYYSGDRGMFANGHAPLDAFRSEEHTSELQSQSNLVCRLLLEKKKTHHHQPEPHKRTLVHRRSETPVEADLLTHAPPSPRPLTPITYPPLLPPGPPRPLHALIL